MHSFDRLRDYCEADGIGFKVKMTSSGWLVCLLADEFRSVIASTFDQAVDGAIRIRESAKAQHGLGISSGAWVLFQKTQRNSTTEGSLRRLCYFQCQTAYWFKRLPVSVLG